MSTSFAGLHTGSNLSFYAIPVAWALAMAPHLYAITLFDKERAPGTKGFDYSMPKRSIRNVENAKLSPEVQDRYLRAEGAQDNGFINLPLFAGAIVAGNLARLPTRTLNIAAGLYLGSRVIYNVLYIEGTNNALGMARTVTWLVGVITSLTLYVQAGTKFHHAL